MVIIQKCCALLETQALKIAFIESASSGYLASQFSIFKNSGADILLGGLVSYDPSIKIEVLKVDSMLIEQYTAESAEVTAAMAIQGHKLFKGANIIIACTGLLKPGGSASSEKPVGTFFIAISDHNHLYEFKYFLEGTPTEKLNQLTQLVAQEIIQIIQQ